MRREAASTCAVHVFARSQASRARREALGLSHQGRAHAAHVPRDATSWRHARCMSCAVASEQSALPALRLSHRGRTNTAHVPARRDFAATCTAHVLRGRKRAECASRAEAVVPGSDKRCACTATRDFAKHATCAAGSMSHPLAHPLSALCPGGPAPAICADACTLRQMRDSMLRTGAVRIRGAASMPLRERCRAPTSIHSPYTNTYAEARTDR
ncbi:hypothetical protein B0H11DRAFT_2416039 [Mycena galericulata]|nr:hypothetical protein B0H11DRAFT_2416039 [Mycena galericulata]